MIDCQQESLEFSHNVLTAWDPTRTMTLRMRMKKDGVGVPSHHGARVDQMSGEKKQVVTEPIGKPAKIWGVQWCRLQESRGVNKRPS